MPTALQAIQLLVAPVIMISAGGLICLALYNRLAAIVTRARAFHKERFDTVTHISRLPLEQQGSHEAHRLRQRIDTLDEQSRRILRRGRLIRNGLAGLLVMILCMLGCSLALGATLWTTAAIYVALALFTLGVLAMMAGIVLSLLELGQSLDPVTLEAQVTTQLDP